MKDDIRKRFEAPKISRRDFCKKATLLTGGGAFASTFSAAAAAKAGATVSSDVPSVVAGASQATVYSTGSDILKIALVGCGDRGTGAASMTIGLEDGCAEIILLSSIYTTLMWRTGF